MIKKNILLIDNYDSFTFNLKHLLEDCQDVILTVKKNNEFLLSDIANFDGAIISAGPGSPEDKDYFGNNIDLILNYGTKGFPILGVCLGFQGIFHAFGGDLKVAKLPVHGKLSRLNLTKNSTLFKDIPSQIQVMRYHSIMADFDSIPACFKLTAFVEDNSFSAVNGKELMALEHKDFPIYGVQFHPESFATEYGSQMIKNFIATIK